MRHVVMYSGGIGSWAAAKRVADQHGTENLTLPFTDTKSEDADTYRFLRASEVSEVTPGFAYILSRVRAYKGYLAQTGLVASLTSLTGTEQPR